MLPYEWRASQLPQRRHRSQEYLAGLALAVTQECRNPCEGDELARLYQTVLQQKPDRGSTPEGQRTVTRQLEERVV